MAFQINTDRYAYSAAPEEVSDNYAAEFAKKLVKEEADARVSADSKLKNDTNVAIAEISQLHQALEEQLALEINSRKIEDGVLEKRIADEEDARSTAVNGILERCGKVEAAVDSLSQHKSDRVHTHTYSDIVSLLEDGRVDYTLVDTFKMYDQNFGDIYSRVYAAEEDMEDVKAQIGDIETALDNIIALQNSLIGGDGV